MTNPLFSQSYRPRVNSCTAEQVTHANLQALALATGGHTWASTLILPGEVICPVGSWVLRLGPGRFVRGPEDFLNEWTPVAPLHFYQPVAEDTRG